MRIVMSILAMGLLGILAVLFIPEGAAADAAMFTSMNCNKCHSISSAGIEKKGGGDEDEEEGAASPDLSHVGKYHDAAFFATFLKREVAHTPHEGASTTKKHVAKFKGTDEDVAKMAAWLASLK